MKGWSSTARPADHIRNDYHRQPRYPLTERDPKTEASKVFGEDWVLSVDEAKGNIEGKLPSLSLTKEVVRHAGQVRQGHPGPAAGEVG